MAPFPNHAMFLLHQNFLSICEPFSVSVLDVIMGLACHKIILQRSKVNVNIWIGKLRCVPLQMWADYCSMTEVMFKGLEKQGGTDVFYCYSLYTLDGFLISIGSAQ